MTHTLSYPRALGRSVLVHLALAGCLAVGFGIAIEEHPQADYVIDLDMYESESGSDSTPPADLFPEPLSAEETHSRMEQAAAAVTAEQSPAPPAPSDITLARGAGNPNAVVAGTNTAPDAPAGPAGGGAGEGAGAGSGTGEGTGSGSGTGPGSGDGDGSRPTTPFDFGGFANAVEANKEYPYQAIKRGLEGSVTMQITLSASGSLIGCDVIGSAGSVLDKAAVKAVQNACPYPNPTGSAVTFSTTLHFILN